MALSGRVAVALAALVTTVPLAACGGDDDGAEATSSQADTTAVPEDTLRLTLTDDGCAYDGPDIVTDGAFAADLENQTEHFGTFAIGALAEGSTLTDLEAYVEKEQQRWDETRELRGPPGFYTQAVRVGVPAGDRGLLPADIEPGTYALTCFVDDVPTWRAYVAAQLDVTG